MCIYIKWWYALEGNTGTPASSTFSLLPSYLEVSSFINNFLFITFKLVKPKTQSPESRLHSEISKAMGPNKPSLS